MITEFTCLRFYRYSSFTLRAYLYWVHSYCQSNAKNVSLKNKMAASHVSKFIGLHMRVFCGVKKMADLL